MLKWLYSAKYDRRHNEVKRDQIKGTEMWLLDTVQYKRWRFEDDTPSFLWYHGGPGTGKTVLTYRKPCSWLQQSAVLIKDRSLVVDELLSADGDDTGVAYVYLDYADRQAQTVENIVASLIKQLSLLKKSNSDARRLYE